VSGKKSSVKQCQDCIKRGGGKQAYISPLFDPVTAFRSVPGYHLCYFYTVPYRAGCQEDCKVAFFLGTHASEFVGIPPAQGGDSIPQPSRRLEACVCNPPGQVAFFLDSLIMADESDPYFAQNHKAACIPKKEVYFL